MSTAPQGWQNPRTNWQAADIVHPSDFNRIEGNIQAIESGSRTLDPSQVPSGNSGSLRQILSWFANRIRAITGATNWYDAPATTLAATKSHMDATSGIHGATSSATANRLVIRDSAGRAQFATPSAAADAATKGYVDSHANATSVHGATSSATPNRIIIRDSAGRAKVTDPSAADDIATKGYVDNSFVPRQPTILAVTFEAPFTVPAGGSVAKFLAYTGPSRYGAIPSLVPPVLGLGTGRDLEVVVVRENRPSFPVPQQGIEVRLRNLRSSDNTIDSDITVYVMIVPFP